MGSRSIDLPAAEAGTAPSTGRPHEAGVGGDGYRLDLVVIFTSLKSTVAALNAATRFADKRARISIVALQYVPYPAPLDSPPVVLEWYTKRFVTLAEECPLETSVRIYLCRNRVETLLSVLKPRSLVVLGGRKRAWRPTSEQMLARRLERAGHDVAFVEVK